jgi:hypothetical protein
MRRIASSVLLSTVLVIGGSLAGLSVGQAAATIPTPPAQVAATTFTTSLPASPSTSQNSQFTGVTCANSTFCVAVGSNSTTGNIVISQWNGTTWTLATVATPGSGNAELNSVSCAGPAFCLAVGDFNGTTDPLAEQWNGSAWTPVTVANVTGSTETVLNDVSCLSATSCTAVGFSTTASLRMPLAEIWNGTAWSITSNAVLPSGATAAELARVSCVTGPWCMAVGTQTVGANSLPLTEMWSGTAWSVVASPNPSPGTDASFNGVSCVGTTYCVAVGNYQDTGLHFRNLVATWNGTAWTQNSVPDGPDTNDDVLQSVACFSATSCSAVGYEGILVPSTPAALAWNGVSWTSVTPPTPPSSTGTRLLTVTCQTNWECLAVGNTTLGGFSQPVAMTAPIARTGYRFVATDGGIFNYGPGAPFIGSLGGTALNAPIVGMAVMPAGDGYYLAASDGGVFNYGSALFHGSAGSLHLNKPIVGMATTADGAGYWLVASDGGIFSYGDAAFYGSTGSLHLNQPIVGMGVTPDGKGYWLVAADGGIFSYGDATFQGSTGSLVLNKPVVGMAPTSSGGYYLVATDGGIFAFPTKNGPPFYGSTGSMTLNKPIVGMTAVAGGYYLSGSDGGVFTFPTTGGPTFYGSTGSIVLNKPIVGISG